MRGKRKDLPTTYSGMEQHLLEAFARLKEGQPENARLIGLSKKGRLKVTPGSVAEEAGVSRTLIGYDGCRYMNVRRKILETELPVRASTDMRSVNADLREINRILEDRLKVALSEQAAMLNRMQKLETEYNDKVEEIARIKARQSRNASEVVGLHVVRSKTDTES